jgi:hypothetical protein
MAATNLCTLAAAVAQIFIDFNSSANRLIFVRNKIYGVIWAVFHRRTDIRLRRAALFH